MSGQMTGGHLVSFLVYMRKLFTQISVSNDISEKGNVMTMINLILLGL